ncbi:MAG: succinate dehydrogenase/fumarate reductase iron-sulfur subunit [Myxococcota bacterium]
MAETLDLTLKVWRQTGPQDSGRFETYQVKGVSEHVSFLEMLDQLNGELIADGKEPVAFEHDCREGICGSCGFMIDGQAHGPERGTTVCQLHMRLFKSGQTVTLEPWRAKPFSIMKDLMVDRNAFDRIQMAGGYASTNCGNAPDGNAVPVGRVDASAAFDAAACIGCGACVASCKNASASLFVGAKIGHFAKLPQGQPERARRALRMVAQMDAEGFGSCTNTLECEAACPKEISVFWIQQMNRDYLNASLAHDAG